MRSARATTTMIRSAGARIASGIHFGAAAVTSETSRICTDRSCLYLAATINVRPWIPRENRARGRRENNRERYSRARANVRARRRRRWRAVTACAASTDGTNVPETYLPLPALSIAYTVNSMVTQPCYFAEERARVESASVRIARWCACECEHIEYR